MFAMLPDNAIRLLRAQYGAALALDTLTTIVAIVGYITIASFVYSAFDALTLYFFPFGKSTFKAYRRTSSGKSYALITGSSGGIGFSLAQQLALRNFGVIILAHIPDEVSEAAANLREKVPGVEVHSIVMDCASATPEEIKKALEPVMGLHIRIVINNVGGLPLSRPYFRTVMEYSAQDLDANINLNARFMAHVTRLTLPILVGNAVSDGGRSLLLTTGSPGRSGLPWTAAYSGSKAFNSGFSNGVKEEMIALNHPVDVLCILPGDVRSSGNTKGVTFGGQTATQFASDALDLTERCLRRDRTEIIPYWFSGFTFWFLDNILGERWKRRVLRGVMKDKKEAYH
jgi:17beta-estradiol 17-dehydrogenase / very-long-chain 3-oxoacyl-CoA reductase